MHELSICNALILEVERIAYERSAGSVSRIVLKIGPLAGIESPLLLRAFPVAAAGTVAEHAKIVIETAEVTVRCTECGSESKVAANRLLCAACGDFRTRLVSGDEMILQSVELEQCGIAPAPSPNEQMRRMSDTP